MSRYLFTVFVAIVIGFTLLLYLFTYQVRSNEVAMVLRFGKPVALPKAGIHFRLPWPIDDVRHFDNRLHVHQDRIEERLTRDQFPIITSLCVGWRISPNGIDQFNKNFGGASDPMAEAWTALDSIIRDRIHVAVGRHDLTDFVSISESHQLAYGALEQEIVDDAQEAAFDTYGIEVVLLKIKRLELPQTVTKKVYDRMKADRNRESERIKDEGAAVAKNIREAAQSEREQILALANATAEKIRGEGDREAAQYYEDFSVNPDLAIYLRKLRALIEVTRNGAATMIVDTKTPPFDLITIDPPDLSDETATDKTD